MIKHQGQVIDQLKSLSTHKTKWYDTYQDAQIAAEKLCKRTLGDRGTININN